jgi:putative acetyltransferase
MRTMFVRREKPEDHGPVAALLDAAFGPGGGRPTAERRLTDELRRDGDAIPALTLVAVLDGVVVGHVMCSRGHVEQRPHVALGPIGVLPRCQRRGVGSALMHAVLGAADALEEQAVFLLGDPGYYTRFGFEPVAAVGISPPEPTWGEHFQVRRLTGWDGAGRGVFRYPAAFGRL